MDIRGIAKVLSWLSMYESFIYVGGGDCLEIGVTGNVGDRELGMGMGDRVREVMVREGARGWGDWGAWIVSKGWRGRCRGGGERQIHV